MDTRPNDDAQLLREFAAAQSQSAFRTLVERYQDMVFGTARRRLGNDQAASDVAQNVFTALAKKAPWLSARTSVGGWLYKSTLMEAARRQRDDIRRLKRERRYAEEMNIRGTSDHDDEAPQLKELMPVLDDAMSGLSSADREALLLRFFRGLSLRDTGVAMGTTEEAARKRVSRALEKLSTLFKRKGVTMPALAIAGTLLPKASSMAAPAAFASKATAAAAALPAPGVAAALYMKAAALSKPAVMALCLTAAAVPVTWQAVRISSLTQENDHLSASLAGAHRTVALVVADANAAVSAAGNSPADKTETVDAGTRASGEKRDRRGPRWGEMHELKLRFQREARLNALFERLGLNENQLAVIAAALEKADADRKDLWDAGGPGKPPPDKTAQDAIKTAQDAILKAQEDTIAAVVSAEQQAAYTDFQAEEEQNRQEIFANEMVSEMQRGGLHLTDAQKDSLFAVFAAQASGSGGDTGPWPWAQMFQEGQVEKLRAALTPEQFRLWNQRNETMLQFFRPEGPPASKPATP